MYNKLRASSRHILRELCISTSVKAKNDTGRPNGLVPSLILFGELAKIPRMPHPSLSPTTHPTAHAIARAAFETAVAKRRIQTSLSPQPPK